MSETILSPKGARIFFLFDRFQQGLQKIKLELFNLSFEMISDKPKLFKICKKNWSKAWNRFFLMCEADEVKYGESEKSQKTLDATRIKLTMWIDRRTVD